MIFVKYQPTPNFDLMCISFKMFTVGCLSLIVFLGCQSRDKEIVSQNSINKYNLFSNSLDTLRKPKIQFNNNLKIILSEWTSYKNLVGEIFIKDEINYKKIKNLDKKKIDELFQNLQIDIPDFFNSQNILSRINVFKSYTIMYNYILVNDSLNNDLKEKLEYRLSNSFSDLKNQMNLLHEKSSQIIIN